MNYLLGIILGAFVGYLMIKRNMDKKYYMILLKSGLPQDTIDTLYSYYKNYDKLVKEVAREQREKALQLERNYSLKCEQLGSEKASKL